MVLFPLRCHYFCPLQEFEVESVDSISVSMQKIDCLSHTFSKDLFRSYSSVNSIPGDQGLWFEEVKIDSYRGQWYARVRGVCLKMI